MTYKAGESGYRVQPPIKVLGSVDNKYIEANKSYRTQVKVKHFAGNEAVGTHSTKSSSKSYIYSI